MRLKKLYDHGSGEPVVSGIKILHSGPAQHFSPKLIEGAMEEGWLSIEDDELTIHAEDGDVVYRILREPGRYEDEVINYYDCIKKEK